LLTSSQKISPLLLSCLPIFSKSTAVQRRCEDWERRGAEAQAKVAAAEGESEQWAARMHEAEEKCKDAIERVQQVPPLLFIFFLPSRLLDF